MTGDHDNRTASDPAAPDGQARKSTRLIFFVLLPLILILVLLGAALVVMRSGGGGDEDDPGLFPVRKAGLWGYIDASGRVVVEPAFEDARDMLGGVALVRRAGSWILLGAGGKPVGDAALEEAGDCHGGLVRVAKDGQWGFVDCGTGKAVVEPAWDEAGDFEQGLAPVRKGDAWGYIDAAGKTVIEPRFLAASAFAGGRARVLVGKGDSSAWAFVDPSGKVLLETPHDFVGDYSAGLCRVKVCEQGSEWCEWGFIDESGKMKIEPQFEWAYDFSEDLALVMSGGRWGFIDATGTFAIQPSFAEAGRFSRGLARASVGGLWGYVDSKGSWVVKPTYYLAGDFEGGIAEAAFLERSADAPSGFEVNSGWIDRTGKFVWNPPDPSKAWDGSRMDRTIWNFDFDTGKIRVIGSFDPTTWELKCREAEGPFTVVPVALPHPAETGNVRGIIPGELYTIIVTDNLVGVTLGWSAMLGGETQLLRMRSSGSDLMKNVYLTALPQADRAGQIVSWALGKDRYFILMRRGVVLARRLDDPVAPLEEFEIGFKPSPEARIWSKDGLLVLLEPGTKYHVMKEVGPGRWEVRARDFVLDPTVTTGAPGPVTVTEDHRGIVARFGDKELILSMDEVAAWMQSQLEPPPDPAVAAQAGK